MVATTTFVPSGAPVSIAPNQSGGTTFAMPTVDGANLDLQVVNNGISCAWLSFAAGAPVGPTAFSNVAILPGASVLCTSNAATLAASAANPAVINPQGGAWQAAPQLSAIVQQTGGALVIQRGTATARSTF